MAARQQRADLPGGLTAAVEKVAPGGEVLLGEAARLVREERFGPTPGPMCQFCEFAVVCPTVERGRAVLT